MYLADFYKLSYQWWGKDIPESDVEPDFDSSHAAQSLAEAVGKFPEECHQALAVRINLNYSEIKNAIENDRQSLTKRKRERESSEFSHAQEQSSTKRHLPAKMSPNATSKSSETVVRWGNETEKKIAREQLELKIRRHARAQGIEKQG